MLVLSRHRDESIHIGDDISITVVEIRGDKVRLGIEAPKDVPVHRQEVIEAIKRDGGVIKPRKPKEHSQPSVPGIYWWRRESGHDWSLLSITTDHLKPEWFAKYGGFWGPQVVAPAK